MSGMGGQCPGGIYRLTQRSGTSKLPLRRAIIDEQFDSFTRGQIIDEQTELTSASKRTDAGSGGIFVGAFTDEFDRSGIVSTKFDRSHGFGYHVTGHCSLPLDRGESA